MRESERRRRVEEHLKDDEDDEADAPQGTAYSAIEDAEEERSSGRLRGMRCRKPRN